MQTIFTNQLGKLLWDKILVLKQFYSNFDACKCENGDEERERERERTEYWCNLIVLDDSKEGQCINENGLIVIKY